MRSSIFLRASDNRFWFAEFRIPNVIREGCWGVVRLIKCPVGTGMFGIPPEDNDSVAHCCPDCDFGIVSRWICQNERLSSLPMWMFRGPTNDDLTRLTVGEGRSSRRLCWLGICLRRSWEGVSSRYFVPFGVINSERTFKSISKSLPVKNLCYKTSNHWLITCWGTIYCTLPWLFQNPT